MSTAHRGAGTSAGLRADIIARLRSLPENRGHSASVIATAGDERLSTTLVWRELILMWEDELVEQLGEDAWGLPRTTPAAAPAALTLDGTGIL
ncbi:hypothetical protein [Miltoncostaea oceani]|uniref:hypothetical protein n=1 Tax=Miltoncostaea oceani TaxID=2843216 RepID=UPI001C3D71C2|nr:hypothetical protein [Miltoncostaea oceani]